MSTYNLLTAVQELIAAAAKSQNRTAERLIIPTAKSHIGPVVVTQGVWAKCPEGEE